MKTIMADIDKKNEKKRYTSASPAVEQAAEILKYLASQGKAKKRLTDISKGLGINTTKTYVILDALQKAGFVSKDGDTKLYSLGPSLIPIGQMALENTSYADAVQPILKEIAKETSCSAMFALIARESLVGMAFQSSGGLLESKNWVGSERPLYFKSHGRIIAAYLPKEERESLIENRSHTFYDQPNQMSNEMVAQDLCRCRKSGFAHDSHDTQTSGIVNWISSAVFDVTNRPIGVLFAIGLVAESSVPALGAKIVEISRRFSALLGADLNTIDRME